MTISGSRHDIGTWHGRSWIPRSRDSPPAPWEWVAVIAFYAAVHVVNAYLWETRRAEPRNHGERWTEVQRSLPINPCRIGYRALFLAGYRARYDETFRLAEQDARLLLDVDYRQVEATVMQALGQPVPAW